MAQVRGSASVTAMLLVLCILLHYKIAVAAKYTVGDDAGWHFNIQSWPTGKKFLANDTLGKVLHMYLKLTYTQTCFQYIFVKKKRACFHLSQAIQFLLLILDFFYW